MTAATFPPTFRISLREFLVVFTVATFGAGALTYANEYWLAIVALATLLVFVAAAIVALVDRGPRQAFAIGMLIAMTVYAAMIYASKPQAGGNRFPPPHPEFDPYDGILPTTLLTRPLFEIASDIWYVDQASGKRVKESELPSGATIVDSGGGFGPGGALPASGYAYTGEFPSRGHFMPIAHCLWALFIGYTAAKFAAWIFARRLREQAVIAPSAAG